MRNGYAIFLGAGAYHHYRPVVIDSLVSRGEFFTAYTPYQPEIAQGTLQAIFEFQTMICELTGMEVANASMYDGSTGAAEAMMMAVRVPGGPRRWWRSTRASGIPRGDRNIRAAPGACRCRRSGYGENGRVDMEALERRLQTRRRAC